ncbi:MAG: MFS transporter [Myxococcota bacterium]|nr:MFS transporter [Myxococcota bacterium]
MSLPNLQSSGHATRVPPNALPSLRRYLLANVGLSFALGIQNVVIGWLVAYALAESPSHIGNIFAALMLPSLFLTLFAGLVADRFDPRRVLIASSAVAAIVVAVLAWIVSRDALTYASLLIFALSAGLIGSFIAPARDALMTRVSGGAVARVVPMLLGASYIGQLVGALTAAFIDHVGAGTMLWLQAGSLVLSTAAYLAMRPPEPHTQSGRDRNPLAEIREGIKLTLDSPRLRAGLAMMATIGLLLGGTYVPLLTVLSRDVYHGGARELSFCIAAMMAGTTATAVSLAWRGGIRRQGLALLIGLALAAGVSMLLSTAPPFGLVLVLAACWGGGGALAIAMTRTISQESAPPSHRARVLSVFHLALTGSAPAGAWGIGVAIEVFEPAGAMLVPGIGLLLAIAAALVFTDLARFDGLNSPAVGPTNSSAPFDIGAD